METKNNNEKFPVAFPLGGDEETAMEIIQRTRFSEYYTGLASETLHGCSMSHHFLPGGCMPAAPLAALARKISAQGSRLTVALNVISFRPAWRSFLEDQVKTIAAAGVHAVVVSNLGVLETVRSTSPKLAVYVSSLAGATNPAALRFFLEAGADRVILPRSMRPPEVMELAKHKPEGLEIEAFILGGGCAFAEHSCNLPHYLFGNGEEAAAKFGLDAIHRCLPQKPGCQSPALVKLPSGNTRVGVLHPGTGACGVCYAPAFLKAGVDILKVTGRTADQGTLLDLALLTDNAMETLISGKMETSDDFIRKCVRDRGECLYRKEWPHD